jgi:hypothetical protein
MRLALVLLTVVGAADGMMVGGTFRKSRGELDDEAGLTSAMAGGRGSWAAGSASVCGAGAAAAVPSARKAVASLLRGGSAPGEGKKAAVSTPPEASSRAGGGTDASDGRQSAASSGGSAPGSERGNKQLTLSPERLAQIGKLSAVLTPISDELAMVPAFTVTVGNTSAPLTIPHGDGERLAYFFVE